MAASTSSFTRGRCHQLFVVACLAAVCVTVSTADVSENHNYVIFYGEHEILNFPETSFALCLSMMSLCTTLVFMSQKHLF